MPAVLGAQSQIYLEDRAVLFAAPVAKAKSVAVSLGGPLMCDMSCVSASDTYKDNGDLMDSEALSLRVLHYTLFKRAKPCINSEVDG